MVGTTFKGCTLQKLNNLYLQSFSTETMRKSTKTTLILFIILHTSEIFLTTLFVTSFKVEAEKVHFSKSLHSTFNETVTLDI